MNLLKSLTRSAWPALGLDDWASYFSYNTNTYPFGLNQTLKGNKEDLDGSFTSLASGAFKGNGVVFACMLARMLLFSDARFAYRKTGGTERIHLVDEGPDLDMLAHPWPGATTGDLLARAIQDVDLAGNFFCVRRNQMGPRPNRVMRLRPDWVTIVLGSNSDSDVQAGDIDAEIVGYLYHPGGRNSGRDPEPLLAKQVCHFAPIPDPVASFRGMSWLQPVIHEILSDGAATKHKEQFFNNGATPNLLVKVNAPNVEKFKEWVAIFEDRHEGVANAYKTLFLGGGADAQVVGTNFQQLDFKVTQGAGETRIAAASGVPAIIVGLSEGLASSTYSNYTQARRRFADGTMRPLWRNLVGSMANIVQVPSGMELWYDDRDIPFLREDATDATTIRQTQAASIKLLIDAGFEAQSAVDAVSTGDWELLQHTGLVSVQLLPPGTPPSPASANGNGAPPEQKSRDLLEVLAPFLPQDDRFRAIRSIKHVERDDHGLISRIVEEGESWQPDPR